MTPIVVISMVDDPLLGYCQICGAGYADAAVSPATRFRPFPNLLAFALKIQGKRGSGSLEGDPTPLL